MRKLGMIPKDSYIDGQIVIIPITPAATITIDLTDGGNFATWTAGQNETINLSGPQKPGQGFRILIKNDGLLPRIITFGTGFKVSTVMTGALGKTTAFAFVSDGTYMYELARTSGL